MLKGRQILLKDIPSNATVDGVCALWAARVGVSEAAHVYQGQHLKGQAPCRDGNRSAKL